MDPESYFQPEPEDDEQSIQALESFEIRYPVLKQLYEFKWSSDHHSKDARCNFCRKQSKKVKISRLMQHSETCPNTDPTLVEELRSAHEEFEERQRLRRERSAAISKMNDIDDSLVNFIATNSLPLNIVSSVSLKELIRKLCPRYRIPSTYKLSQCFLAERAAAVNSLAKDRLRENPDCSLTIEFDGWTSNAGQSLLAVTITNRLGRSWLADLVDISDAIRRYTLLSKQKKLLTEP